MFHGLTERVRVEIEEWPIMREWALVGAERRTWHHDPLILGKVVRPVVATRTVLHLWSGANIQRQGPRPIRRQRDRGPVSPTAAKTGLLDAGGNGLGLRGVWRI